MRRAFSIGALVIVMGGFGFGVNRWVASRKVDLTKVAAKPNQVAPLFALPGTVYVSQAGVLYGFHAGKFNPIPLPTKDAQGEPVTWTQPAALPNGNILAVMRGTQYSDLYEVSPSGQELAQLTHDYASNTADYVRDDHWVAWPHVSSNGATLFFTLDSPKVYSSYEVDFNIWATPLNFTNIVTASKYLTAATVHATHWTTPSPYTGGDTDPLPLANGKLMYVTYQVGASSQLQSTLQLQASPYATSVALTTPDQDCNAAALSPDQTEVAMICSSNTQSTKLEVAKFNGSTLSNVTTLVDNCLCASPTWSPDGNSLVYLAPSDATGNFQLWWINNANSAAPTPTKQVTSSLALDATSPPAWSAPPVVTPASPTPAASRSTN